MFVADLCYLLNAHGIPKMAPGYEGDILGEYELLTRLAVRDGNLILPDGGGYSALVLPEAETMTPQVAERIRQLVRDGATVIGGKPLRSSSLENFPDCDVVVARIANEVWGDTDDGVERAYGRGRVVWGKTAEQVLAEKGIGPDVRLEAGSSFLWTHRRLPDADIYFVSNQADEPVSKTVGFRVSGRPPELWDADTGEISLVRSSAWTVSGDRTDIHLSLDPAGSVFVVFRQASGDALEFNANSHAKDAKLPDTSVISSTLPVEGPWALHFPPQHGAPESVTLDRLKSWTEHPTSGVKFFSGTATYVTKFDLAVEDLAERRQVTIDLGEVKTIAEVTVNGQSYPALWKPPFRRDITDAVHPGRNRLEIRVTNLWPNRLIGDEHEPDDCDWGEPVTFVHVEPAVVVGRPLLRAPQWLLAAKPRPSTGRYTFSTFKFFTKDSPLLPSGLLGPVKLECALPVE